MNELQARLAMTYLADLERKQEPLIGAEVTMGDPDAVQQAESYVRACFELEEMHARGMSYAEIATDAFMRIRWAKGLDAALDALAHAFDVAFGPHGGA